MQRTRILFPFPVLCASVLPGLAPAADEKERPLLQPWHTVLLQNEFMAGDEATIKTIADYQTPEEKLFAELDARTCCCSHRPSACCRWRGSQARSTRSPRFPV